MKEESEKYAKILGYNYQSSTWYKNSYSIFNKNYKIDVKNKEMKDKINKNNFLKKIKSLFN